MIDIIQIQRQMSAKTESNDHNLIIFCTMHLLFVSFKSFPRLINWSAMSLSYFFASMLLGPAGFNWCFSFAPELVSNLVPRDLHRRAAKLMEFIMIYLFVHDDSLTS